MTRELTIGSPGASHIVWVDWNAYREAIISAMIESIIRKWDWNLNDRKPKNERKH